jgi:photosystem II stability/assembly factor-like uncharacterized protein
MNTVIFYPKSAALALTHLLAVFAAALLLFGLSHSPPVFAEQALIMPRASESLLLDATRAGDRLLVAGDYGHILFSDDSGETWEQAKVPMRQALTALSFPDSDRGWAVGHDGNILATIDGGESWVLQRDGLKAQKILNEENLARLQREIEVANNALLNCDNAEERYELQEIAEELELDVEDATAVLEEPVFAPPLMDVFFSDEVHGVAVGAFNTLLRTSDGGVSWELESSLLDNPYELHLNAVTGDENNRFWIAGEGGLLFRSVNATGSWESLQSPYEGSLFGIIRAPEENTLLVFGLRGNVFRSDDSGDSWQRVDAGSDRTLAGGMFVNKDYVLLVGSVGGLLVSDDAGRTFQQATSGVRVHLSAVVSIADTAIMVGQGGVHRVSPFGSSK